MKNYVMAIHILFVFVTYYIILHSSSATSSSDMIYMNEMDKVLFKVIPLVIAEDLIT